MDITATHFLPGVLLDSEEEISWFEKIDRRRWSSALEPIPRMKLSLDLE